jgi:hypothetical protein
MDDVCGYGRQKTPGSFLADTGKPVWLTVHVITQSAEGIGLIQ